MSEAIELSLLLTITTVKTLFSLGRYLAQGSSQEKTSQERHLVRRDTQINDGQLLRRAVDTVGLSFIDGDPDQVWGIKIDGQILDAEDKPWFAFAYNEKSQSYDFYSHDLNYAQSNLPLETRLSEMDVKPVMDQVVQQYGYLIVLRSLHQNGFEIKNSVDQNSKGDKVITLQKNDASGEYSTVKLNVKAQDGQATILTDSRQEDGSHGTCPDIDRMLQSIGIEKYEKWGSPTAKRIAGSSRNDDTAGESKLNIDEDSQQFDQDNKLNGVV